MKRFLNNFKANKTRNEAENLNILFDIAIVAIVSLIFNGFIINNKSSFLDQKIFMAFNAGILSIHWYQQMFFRQRYTKANSFFKIWVFLEVLSLLIMATGVDLMVFMKNKSQQSQHFIRWTSMVIYLAGFILARLMVSFQFLLAALANKNWKEIFLLTIYKSISRFMTLLLSIVHIAIIIIFKDKYLALATYIFFPLYLVIEFAGNVMMVKDKILNKVPKLSMNAAKQRYGKLTLLYITSMFISGTIQFTFYFNGKKDLLNLINLLMTYIIGFVIWWAYMDRVYRFKIYNKAIYLVSLSLMNVILSISLVLTGSMLINLKTTTHLSMIIPTIYFALSSVLIVWSAFLKIIKRSQNEFCMSRDLKYKMLYHLIPLIIIFITLGIVSLFINMPLYVFYPSIIILFIIINILSRIRINKSKTIEIKVNKQTNWS